MRHPFQKIMTDRQLQVFDNYFRAYKNQILVLITVLQCLATHSVASSQQRFPPCCLDNDRGYRVGFQQSAPYTFSMIVTNVDSGQASVRSSQQPSSQQPPPQKIQMTLAMRCKCNKVSSC